MKKPVAQHAAGECVGPVTFVLVKVAAQRSFVCERGGDELGQHGEVCGAVGTSSQRVEGVVASSPHGALIRNQVWRSVLIRKHRRACFSFLRLQQHTTLVMPLCNQVMQRNLLKCMKTHRLFP